jgi:hypothetical protein
MLIALVIACLVPLSAPAAGTSSSTQSYANGPLCGATYSCTSFLVPSGATTVELDVTDDLSPHAGGEWCYDSCGGTIGLFCDAATVSVGAASTLIVVPDEGGSGGIAGCLLGPALATGLGEATSGSVDVRFS